MKKEMLISVLVGLVFGLIIVYGVYTAQNSLNEPSQNIEELTASPSPVESDNPNTDQLSIYSPENESIVNQSATTVSGSTLSKNYVVIFINDTEFITTSDESGHFSIEGELELGSNIIQVTVITPDGETITQERTVVYTTQPLVEASPDSAKEATPEAEINQ